MHFENNRYYATLDSVKKGWYNLAVLQKNCRGAESASVGKIWFHWDGRIFFAYFSNVAKNVDDIVEFITEGLSTNGVKNFRLCKTADNGTAYTVEFLKAQEYRSYF